MDLPIHDRFLIIAAKFQNIRFMGVSVYDSVLRGVRVKKKEKPKDIQHEELVSFDEHSVSLTVAGEEKLRTLSDALNNTENIETSSVSRRDNNLVGLELSLHESKPKSRSNPNKNLRIHETIGAFKLFLRRRGFGITPAEGESVTKQFKDICVKELGASPEDINKLYIYATKSDKEIAKLSFNSGIDDDSSKVEIQYLGLIDFSDDPLSQSQQMVNNLREMLEEYTLTIRQLRLHFDPEIYEFRQLCDQMSQTDWTEFRFEKLETYSKEVLLAIRKTAIRTRELRQQHLKAN